ncbi:MAG: Ni/Fe-hydrogenase, b-type cytochrome subunit [Acidobacteria bacterium]|nr:Ni/Fe-hydrogenase, b-type cytochrome subunit [Acidobacteriota bacterium]MBI3427196.1 Ni/Fe-hydrogenase, b-type cytochrome subunit [Acidobacteriota bacterium]
MAARILPSQIVSASSTRTEQTVRYYVWDRAVRAGHWLNFVCLIALVFTGFYIGGPFYRPTVDEPFFASTMATMKNVHFLAAVFFSVNGLFRVYWFFGGKTYRHWFRFHLWQASFWREVWWKLREYLSLRYIGHYAPTLDHNALASLTYTLLFLACAFISVTGFAMKGAINPDGTLSMFFGWVIPFLGGEASVRGLHRLTMWLILGFAVHHIGFVIYYEVLTERGLISSIITGYKSRPSDWQEKLIPWKKD